jgi:hypothetical protein
MTSGLLTSRRTKIHLLKTSLAFPTDSNKQKFKTYRNLYNKIIKVAKKTICMKDYKNAKKNPIKTWDILREFTGKSKGENSIRNICSEGQIYTEDGEIANQFNKFFSSVGNQISDNVEHTDAKYTAGGVAAGLRNYFSSRIHNLYKYSRAEVERRYRRYQQ